MGRRDEGFEVCMDMNVCVWVGAGMRKDIDGMASIVSCSE